MPKSRAATPEPASDLASLLGAEPLPEAQVEHSSPVLPRPDRAPVEPPAPSASDDVPAEVIVRWFAPLQQMPVFRQDGFGGKDLVLPFTVLLVAAVLARGSDERTVHVDLVAQSFPRGVASACMPILAARGWVRHDPTSGLVTIIKTPVELP